MIDHLEVVFPVHRRHILQPRQLQCPVVTQNAQQAEELLSGNVERGTLRLRIVLRR